MKDENIYKGNRRKKTTIKIEVYIPDGLTEEDKEEFLNQLMITIRSKGQIWYKKGSLDRSVSVKGTIEPGWEIIK